MIKEMTTNEIKEHLDYIEMNKEFKDMIGKTKLIKKFELALKRELKNRA